MEEKTLVLGSGVSALAYLFYNPSAFALAGEEVGGLFKKSQDLGPQLIWVTKSTTKLLNDMGYNNLESRSVSVGYLYQGKLWTKEDLEGEGCMAEVKRLYSLKTRGTRIKTSHMSSGQGAFEVFTLPVDQLVDALLERVAMRLIRLKALEIDLYERWVYTQPGARKFNYDNLVSTIPAPVFLNIIGHGAQAKKLIGYDKAYEKSTETSGGIHDFEKKAGDMGFDYVYVVDHADAITSGFYFHRTRILLSVLGERGVVREYTQVPGFMDNFDCVSPKALIQKQGQIVSGDDVLNSLPKNVEFLGRYAEWRHDRRLEDVLGAIQ